MKGEDGEEKPAAAKCGGEGKGYDGVDGAKENETVGVVVVVDVEDEAEVGGGNRDSSSSSNRSD